MLPVDGAYQHKIRLASIYGDSLRYSLTASLMRSFFHLPVFSEILIRRFQSGLGKHVATDLQLSLVPFGRYETAILIR